MKTNLVTPLAAFLLFSSALSAQKNMVDSTLQSQKAQAQLKVINNASSKLSTGIDNVFNGNMFKRKAKPNQSSLQDSAQAHPAQNALEIKIDSVDYSSLSHYSEILRQNARVKDVKPKFSNHTGFLEVAYMGAPDEILNDLLKKSEGKLTVNEISDASVSLTLNK